MDFRFVDFLEILKIKITLNNLQVDLLRFVLFPVILYFFTGVCNHQDNHCLYQLHRAGSSADI